MIVKTFSHLDALPKADWKALSHPDFPFADYEYLHALEASASVGENTGWSPLYVTTGAGDRIQGAMSLYTKSHSYGEYIFDWSWAEAYLRYQVPYYPKLVAAVPFTPATGPKLLFAADADREAAASDLIVAALREMEARAQSSFHALFITPEEIGYFERAGFLIRHSYQYHWNNAGYARFEDFLAALKPRKRKQIARERAQLMEEKLTLKVVTGEAITADHALLFFQFYLSTISKRQAIPYLREAFFLRVFETMKDRIVLFLAEDGTETVAGSLCYFKGNTLFGRYWGASRDVRNLHFELCYYQPIEWAIGRGLKRFEAGAQGEHKVARGFLPTLTYSAHWIRHPGFRDAIGRFIEEEKTAIADLFEETRTHSPFATDRRQGKS